MKQEFYFSSRDGETQIHAVEWIPEGEVKAILQMCHGMVEHIERYHSFASWLAQKGIYVVGNDHLGHGKSVTSSEKLGFFHDGDGKYPHKQGLAEPGQPGHQLRPGQSEQAIIRRGKAGCSHHGVFAETQPGRPAQGSAGAGTIKDAASGSEPDGSWKYVICAGGQIRRES